MRQFKMEPTWKKSVVEYTQFFKDGVHLTREEGWRGATFLINIPETEEEFLEWCNEKGYETIEEVKEWYSHVFENEAIVDKYLAICGPDLGDKNFEMDDYDHEMVEMWDGCWADWTIATHGEISLTEEEKDELLERIEELYDEDHIEGLEQDGWEQTNYWVEIQCPVTLEECVD
jgi:hypothetical protein